MSSQNVNNKYMEWTESNNCCQGKCIGYLHEICLHIGNKIVLPACRCK